MNLRAWSRGRTVWPNGPALVQRYFHHDPAVPGCRSPCQGPAPRRPPGPEHGSTSAVKQGGNTANHGAKAGGTRSGSAVVAARRRFGVIAVVELSRTGAARVVTSASLTLYHDRHGRGSDHPRHRELPLPARAVARRAPQPRLHTLSCEFRCAGRASPVQRAGQSRRGTLLLATIERRWGAKIKARGISRVIR
jgi:hypothetical protein